MEIGKKWFLIYFKTKKQTQFGADTFYKRKRNIYFMWLSTIT